ncbi:MAG: hypothetical protein HC773_03115 [Scytonema sp. CRU_2_7]|nr:hypothetical protein [Scytonema sp. CRU_2_7]
MKHYLTIDEFCTCSKTYNRYQDLINPYPQNPDSVGAIEKLFTYLINPIIDRYRFENFQLTYGFSSVDLIKYLNCKDPVTGQKNGRICPAVDQHAAHERRNGTYICRHLGAACDFRIKDVSSSEVTRWIVGNLDYDSLYFYGCDRSIHLSYAQVNKRTAWGFTAKNTPIKLKLYDT